LREALAATDHDFVLSEPASKLKRLREKLLTARRRGFSQTARRNRRTLSAIAAGFFIAAAAAILLNALAWQRTRHPAPLFAHAVPAVPAKEPTIAEMIAVPASRRQAAVPALQAHDKPSEKPAAQKPLIEKPGLETPAGGHPRPARVNASLANSTPANSTPANSAPANSAPANSAPANSAPAKPHDKISQFLKAPAVLKAPLAPRGRSTALDPARRAAAPSKPVLAAQRALVKLGFVLNPDGVAGETTRRAIERYEHDHGLPVHGDLTPALMLQLITEAGITAGR
jgi:Putative peptidoglycan binding domain